MTTGLGFRLRDHVNMVFTIDSPLKGSPIADKNGKEAPMVKRLVSSSTAAVSTLFNGISFGGAEGVAGKIVLSQVVNEVADKILGAMLGGYDSPLAKDLGPGSSFLNNLKDDGIAPKYYYKDEQIPYTCYVGRSTDLIKWALLAEFTCSRIAGSYLGFSWKSLFRPPRIATALA